MALDPLTAGLEIGSKLIERIWPDPSKRAEAQLELEKLRQSGELQVIVGQLEINKEEAKSTNWFVAGWRPFIGWICGAALLYVAILEPIARFVATMQGYAGAFPAIDWGIISQVLLGILGLGGMRTLEKIKGGEKNR